MSLRGTLITAAIVLIILVIGAFLTSRGMNPLDRIAGNVSAPTAPPPATGTGG